MPTNARKGWLRVTEFSFDFDINELTKETAVDRFVRMFPTVAQALTDGPDIAVLDLSGLDPSVAELLAEALKVFSKAVPERIIELIYEGVAAYIKGSWRDTDDEGKYPDELEGAITQQGMAILDFLASLHLFIGVSNHSSHLGTEALAEVDNDLNLLLDDLDKEAWPMQSGLIPIPDDPGVHRCRICGEKTWFIFPDEGKAASFGDAGEPPDPRNPDPQARGLCAACSRRQHGAKRR